MNKKLFLKIILWTTSSITALVILFSIGLYVFKDELIQAILQKANEHLKTKVKIEKVDVSFWSSFPNLSVDFHNIFIQDSYYNSTEKDTLFYSEKIRLRFNPIDIYKENYRLKRIDISPGTLHIKIDSAEITNYDIFLPTSDTSSTAIDFDLQRITIDNVLFSFDDQTTNYFYKSLFASTELKGNFAQQLFTLHAKSTLHVHDLKKGKVSFLSEKEAEINLNLQIDQNQKTIKIPATTIQIAELPFEIDGSISPNKTSISVKAQEIQLDELVNNFTLDELKTITHYKGNGKIKFELLVENENEQTTINCRFGINNGQLYEPTHEIQLSNINLNGHYSNFNENDILEITTLNFKTETGIFNGNITVSDFDQPIFKGNANGVVDLLIAHQLFNLPKIEQANGNITIDADFNFQLLNSKKININHCRGTVLFDNNTILLTDYNKKIQSLNGKIDLQDNQINIEQLYAKIEKSDFLIDGEITNVAQYWNKKTQKNEIPYVSISLHSEKLNIDELLPATEQKNVNTKENETFLFDKFPQIPQILNGTLKINAKNIIFNEGNVKQFSGTVNLNKGIVTTNQLSIKQLHYQKHKLDNIQGTVFFNETIFSINKLSFISSQSYVNGTLQLEQKSTENFIVLGQFKSENMPIKKIFEDWDNFSQNTIQHTNINGDLDANIQFNIPINSKTGIALNEMQTNMKLKLQNGELKELEIFHEIIKNINTPATKLVIGAANIKYFEKQLADLKFQTIENTIIIEKGTIYIPKMDINSSALNISLSGQHAFNDSIDYQFAFRLRDLKEKKISEFGEIIDDGTGLIVYLRMYGTTQKPQFSWNKEAQKIDKQNYNKQEKQIIKEMMKKEFGISKNDSTIKEYKENKRNKEFIIVEPNSDPKINSEENVNEPQKKGKVKKLLEKMETEKNNSKKVEVEWE